MDAFQGEKNALISSFQAQALTHSCHVLQIRRETHGFL